MIYSQILRVQLLNKFKKGKASFYAPPQVTYLQMDRSGMFSPSPSILKPFHFTPVLTKIDWLSVTVTLHPASQKISS